MEIQSRQLRQQKNVPTRRRQQTWRLPGGSGTELEVEWV